MENQQINQEENKAPKKGMGLIAIVEYYQGPLSAPCDAPVPIEFLQVQTKKEMTAVLANPSIKTIFGVIRGKKLEFNTSRKVTFS